ncbi:histidine phosphatase family protein, partial [Bifidobacterium apri]
GEESGVAVELGALIGDVEYPLAEEGRRKRHTKNTTTDQKHVVYWMATPITEEADARRHTALGPILPADKDEIDTVVWVPVPRARRLLTHALDRTILDRFVALVKAGAAQSRTLLIVRHGKAEARKQWKGQDCNRPITPRGAAAAFALGRELACYSPDRLVSSPWLRCMQT